MATIITSTVTKSISATNDADGSIINITINNTTTSEIANLHVVAIYTDPSTTTPYGIFETITVPKATTVGEVTTNGTKSISLAIPTPTAAYSDNNLSVALAY